MNMRIYSFRTIRGSSIKISVDYVKKNHAEGNRLARIFFSNAPKVAWHGEGESNRLICSIFNFKKKEIDRNHKMSLGDVVINLYDLTKEDQ